MEPPSRFRPARREPKHRSGLLVSRGVGSRDDRRRASSYLPHSWRVGGQDRSSCGCLQSCQQFYKRRAVLIHRQIHLLSQRWPISRQPRTIVTATCNLRAMTSLESGTPARRQQKSMEGTCDFRAVYSDTSMSRGECWAARASSIFIMNDMVLTFLVFILLDFSVFGLSWTLYPCKIAE